MSELRDDFCEQILALDNSIRYAGVLDRSERIVMQAHRKGKEPLLPPDVAEISLRHAAERMRERILLRPYIGSPLYVVAVYEKVTRVTIPLEGKYYLLALSLDTDSEHEKIVKDKIMPFLKEHGLTKF